MVRSSGGPSETFTLLLLDVVDGIRTLLRRGMLYRVDLGMPIFSINSGEDMATEGDSGEGTSEGDK
jgi:hypothetical protein